MTSIFRTARPAVALLATLAIALPSANATAEEGMWTFDQPPSVALKERYGFTPSAQWLEALRLSAVRIGGGSGAFVSRDGLVLTNHHVALGCISDLSTGKRDYAADGFLAARRAVEPRCPGMEVVRLESIDDVTAAVRAGIKATDDAAITAERNVAIAAIERDCKTKTGLRCEVVTLYRGAAFALYRYRAFDDVRLVFAPESRIGFFGGDPDNFVYPRFDLDVAFLRIYDKGAPVHPANWLRFAKTGVAEGDLVFSVGNPGGTDRVATMTQFEFDRDVRYPMMIDSAKRQRRVLQQFSARSPEAARRASDNLFGTENWLKGMQGEQRALADPALARAKRSSEDRLRTAFATPGSVGDPWRAIDTAVRRDAATLSAHWVVGYGYHTLFDRAGKIVEMVAESALPDDDRLPAYRASAIDRLKLRLTADEPIYKDLEIARLAGYWQEAIDRVGADDPFVRRVLQGKSPLEAATAVIEGTKLDQAEVRRALIEGGATAIAASTDPLVALARDIYPMRRRLARFHEIEVETPTLRAFDDLERLRLRLLGTEAWPDATGTLRLSFGVVRGYDADGVNTPWHTNYYGLYGRSSAFGGRPPYDLPRRWLERRAGLDLRVPLDFVATLDIIGGNSGSPIVNRDGDLVGVVFDGNLESLGGRFAYTEEKARTIAVDARAIVEALARVYRAHDLAAEIQPR